MARSQLKEAELGGRLAGLELDHVSWLAGQDVGDFPLTQRKRPREPEPIPPTIRPADALSAAYVAAAALAAATAIGTAATSNPPDSSPASEPAVPVSCDASIVYKFFDAAWDGAWKEAWKSVARSAAERAALVEKHRKADAEARSRRACSVRRAPPPGKQWHRGG